MRRHKEVAESTAVRQSPALTPEGREDQMIAYAIDLAEEQLRNGTASSQVITHYLKLGSMRERQERKKLEEEIRLLEAKTQAIKSAEETEKMYAAAIEAMKRYTPQWKE